MPQLAVRGEEMNGRVGQEAVNDAFRSARASAPFPTSAAAPPAATQELPANFNQMVLFNVVRGKSSHYVTKVQPRTRSDSDCARMRLHTRAASPWAQACPLPLVPDDHPNLPSHPHSARRHCKSNVVQEAPT